MNLRIYTAVATLLASAPAAALDLSSTIAADVAGRTLTLSGALAGRDAFMVMMANHACQVGTFDVYRASPAAGQDFRAYSCRILNDFTFGQMANQTVVVYYRSEGDSAWGPVPMSQGTACSTIPDGDACTPDVPICTPGPDIAITRLNVDASCTPTSSLTVAGTLFTVHECPVPASDYQIATDTSASNDANLVLDTVDLGVSDLEPKMFSGVNFPTISTRLTAIPPGSRTSNLFWLDSYAQQGWGQVFGVVVSTASGSPFAGSTTKLRMSRTTLGNIFNGTYKNWNEVPGPDGNFLSATSLPIRVCRYEPGVGTQVAVHQYTIGTAACSPTTPNGTFVTDGPDADDTVLSADTDGVIERLTSTAVGACVAGLAGGIGFLPANAAPVGTAYIQLDGLAPTRNDAALDNYRFWYELALTINPRLAGSSPQRDLAQGLIDTIVLQTSVPNVSSALALPNLNNDPFGQGPFSTAIAPIAFSTRNGDSCK